MKLTALTFIVALLSQNLFAGVPGNPVNVILPIQNDKGMPEPIQKPEILAGTYTMATTTNYKPSGCDILMNLTLENSDLTGAFATMSLGVHGLCEIFVVPTVEFSNLYNQTDSCGSQIYEGRVYRAQDGWIDIQVTDNTSRLCEDVIPAIIVVKMSNANWTGDKYWYSIDQQILPIPL